MDLFLNCVLNLDYHRKDYHFWHLYELNMSQDAFIIFFFENNKNIKTHNIYYLDFSAREKIIIRKCYQTGTSLQTKTIECFLYKETCKTGQKCGFGQPVVG